VFHLFDKYICVCTILPYDDSALQFLELQVKMLLLVTSHPNLKSLWGDQFGKEMFLKIHAFGLGLLYALI